MQRYVECTKPIQSGVSMIKIEYWISNAPTEYKLPRDITKQAPDQHMENARNFVIIIESSIYFLKIA